jgi:hypothetical protein
MDMSTLSLAATHWRRAASKVRSPVTTQVEAFVVAGGSFAPSGGLGAGLVSVSETL